ncbi:DUF389 domain-containing protein [Pseudonocardia sp. C8]|uniref:DUF389 domain-containing protein n=1 Tax=Pseudonocardia sp. C8 TaxID=2762759 RepID=UPI001642731A|nr:DUF389 domain-containing protein [Pseudonocardia sp. C8]MBC3191915.1 DUF389 domain-containing protein [Pseudonocardia sp. C8]
MMHLRVVSDTRDTDAVIELLEAEPGVAHLVITPGVSRQPAGDVVEAEVARAVAEDVLQRLSERGLTRRGGISLQPVHMMLSDTADAAERATPGDSDDTVIWDELVATTGDESRLNPTFLAFLTIACLLAAVGVVTDSVITVVGAMVVGPDFGPLAALAVAVVGKRRDLAARAGLALGVGFPFAMLVTAAFTLLARATGLFDPASLRALDDVSFIYQVGPWSVIVALLAGAAGMVALTSEKSGPLIGVFISVTTVPAAGFAAVAAVAGDWHDGGGAALQLVINLAGITVAGVLTLLLRRGHVVPRASAAPAPHR